MLERGSPLPSLLIGAAAGAALVLTVQTLSGKRSREGKSAPEEEDAPAQEVVESTSWPSLPQEDLVCRSPSPTSPRLRPELNLAHVNQTVVCADVPAEACIKWALDEFGDGLVMSTSFGMQSAVLLHMATSIVPNIPVIWIDTGYLHRETYLFARHLAKRLNLNLRVYQSDVSPARMEALHGQLWNNDDGVSHRVYGVLRKVAPMNRALNDLGAHALLSGVRKGQTDHRDTLQRVVYHEGQRHFRIHPLLHWTKQDVDEYIARHKLPYHPLKRKGYVSIGDAHSTKPIDDANKVAEEKAQRSTRFGGKQQECGLHTEQADLKEIDEIVRRLVDDSSAESDSQQQPVKPHSPIGSGTEGSPRMRQAASEDSLLSFSPSQDDVIGTNKGIEIYGRPSCKFCDAACRVLTSRGLPFTLSTMQRFNQETGQLEPPHNDGVTVVSRADVERRIQAVHPGLPPIETVPQIFKEGEYVGGFTELCVALKVPKSVMDVALLQIGGALPINGDEANTWNVGPSLRRGPTLHKNFFSPEQ